MNHQRWTQSDITDLRAKLQSGATPTEVATAMRRAADDVTTMMSRLRLRAVATA